MQGRPWQLAKGGGRRYSRMPPLARRRPRARTWPLQIQTSPKVTSRRTAGAASAQPVQAAVIVTFPPPAWGRSSAFQSAVPWWALAVTFAITLYGAAPASSTRTLTVLCGDAPATLPYTAATCGPLWRTAWSEKTSLKYTPLACDW